MKIKLDTSILRRVETLSSNSFLARALTGLALVAILIGQFSQPAIQELLQPPLKERSFTAMHFTTPTQAAIGFQRGDTIQVEIENHGPIEKRYTAIWAIGTVSESSEILVDADASVFLQIQLPAKAHGTVVITLKDTNISIHAKVN